MKRINGIRIYENGIIIDIIPKKNKLNAEQKEYVKSIKGKKKRKSIKEQFQGKINEHFIYKTTQPAL